MTLNSEVQSPTLEVMDPGALIFSCILHWVNQLKYRLCSHIGLNTMSLNYEAQSPTQMVMDPGALLLYCTLHTILDNKSKTSVLI